MMEIIYIGIVYLFLAYIMLIFLLSHPKNKRLEVDINHELIYYFLVPCVNEERVISNTIQSLLDIDHTCKVIAIDDDSKDKTYDLMKEFDTQRCLILKREFPNAQKGKGVALNAALKLCIDDVNEQNINTDNVIIGVVDADGKLSTNSINELNKSFSNRKVSAAQMRVKMYPDFKNSLQVVQDFEFFTVNNLAQSARIKTKSVGLSGNGQFFRLAPILKKIGEEPWGDSLLDDYELTLKLMMNGLKIDYISSAFVYQEALVSINRFIKQRSRWVQGNLECLKYLKEVKQSKNLFWTQKMSIYYFLSQPYLNLFADIYILIFFIKYLIRVITSLEIIKGNFVISILSFLIIILLSVRLRQELCVNGKSIPLLN